MLAVSVGKLTSATVFATTVVSERNVPQDPNMVVGTFTYEWLRERTEHHASCLKQADSQPKSCGLI